MTTATKTKKPPRVKFTYQHSPREFPHIVEMMTVFVEAYNNYQPAYRISNLDSGVVSYSTTKPEENERIVIEELSLAYLYAELTDSTPDPD